MHAHSRSLMTNVVDVDSYDRALMYAAVLMRLDFEFPGCAELADELLRRCRAYADAQGWAEEEALVH